MAKYILKRLFFGLITVIGISIIIFSVIHFIPGDPITVMFGLNPNPQLMEIAREHYGFDKPVVIQYFNWAKIINTINNPIRPRAMIKK